MDEWESLMQNTLQDNWQNDHNKSKSTVWIL